VLIIINAHATRKKTTGSHPSGANNNKRARDPKNRLLVVTLVVLIIRNAHVTRKKKLLVVTLVVLIIINAYATRKNKTTGSHPTSANNKKTRTRPGKKTLVVTLVVLIIINAHATRENKLLVVTLVVLIIISARATRKQTAGSHPSSANNNKRARDPKKNYW